MILSQGEQSLVQLLITKDNFWTFEPCVLARSLMRKIGKEFLGTRTARKLG